MPKRNHFTAKEIAQIRQLLIQKQKADRAEQIHIRNQLRALGFYISDYYDVIPRRRGGFSVEDFDTLIQSKRIKVKD